MSPALRRALLVEFIGMIGEPILTETAWRVSGLYPDAVHPGCDQAITDLLALLATGCVRIWHESKRASPLRWVTPRDEHRAFVYDREEGVFS